MASGTIRQFPGGYTTRSTLSPATSGSQRPDLCSPEPCGFHLTCPPQGTDPSSNTAPSKPQARSSQEAAWRSKQGSAFPHSRPPGTKEATRHLATPHVGTEAGTQPANGGEVSGDSAHTTWARVGHQPTQEGKKGRTWNHGGPALSRRLQRLLLPLQSKATFSERQRAARLNAGHMTPVS